MLMGAADLTGEGTCTVGRSSHWKRKEAGSRSDIEAFQE